MIRGNRLSAPASIGSATVYLDTAILLNVLDGKVGTDLLGQLLRMPGISWVFSPALHDDLVKVDASRLQSLLALVGRWPNQRWAAPGNVIPAWEVEQLLQREPAVDPLVVVFQDADQLIASLPAYFQILETGKPSAAWVADMRRTRASQKVKVAEADTASKQAWACSRNPSVERNVRVQRYLAGDADAATPDVVAEWEATRELARVALDDLFAQDPAWFERAVEQASAFFGQSPEQIRAAIEWMPSMLEAIACGDSAGLAVIDRQAAASIAEGGMSLVNPLGLKPNSKQYFAFQRFLAWLPDSERPAIARDRRRLSRCFRDWYKAHEICPAGFVVREVAWQMHLDHGTTSTASDQTDLYHVALLPYLDVLFVDKRIAEYVDRTPIPDEWKRRCVCTGSAGS